MKIIFGLSYPDYTVDSVCWKQDGEIHERTLMSDGSVRDRIINNPSLYWVWVNWGSSHHPLHATEVLDIRTAFKYLGKKSDLIELLPETTIELGE